MALERWVVTKLLNYILFAIVLIVGCVVPVPTEEFDRSIYYLMLFLIPTIVQMFVYNRKILNIRKIKSVLSRKDSIPLADLGESIAFFRYVYPHAVVEKSIIVAILLNSLAPTYGKGLFLSIGILIFTDFTTSLVFSRLPKNQQVQDGDNNVAEV